MGWAVITFLLLVFTWAVAGFAIAMIYIPSRGYVSPKLLLAAKICLGVAAISGFLVLILAAIP